MGHPTRDLEGFVEFAESQLYQRIYPFFHRKKTVKKHTDLGKKNF